MGAYLQSGHPFVFNHMKKIPLTQGKFTIVDDEDFTLLSQWKWKYHRDRNNGGYAVRTDYSKGRRNGKTIAMHRVLFPDIPGLHVDHINRDKLDNRKENLRRCTKSDNQHNARMRKDNTSGYRGVTWCKKRKLWLAMIRANGKPTPLGGFSDKKDAAIAYNIAASKYFGGFAHLNQF